MVGFVLLMWLYSYQPIVIMARNISQASVMRVFKKMCVLENAQQIRSRYKQGVQQHMTAALVKILILSRITADAGKTLSAFPKTIIKLSMFFSSIFFLSFYFPFGYFYLFFFLIPHISKPLFFCALKHFSSSLWLTSLPFKFRFFFWEGGIFLTNEVSR